MGKGHRHQVSTLREDLIDAAKRMVIEGGDSYDPADDLIMRKLAQEVGVSVATPYLHFHDATELLAELACTGFDELLRLSVPTGGDPEDAIVAMALQYVTFGTANPRRYRVMFHPKAAAPPRAVVEKKAQVGAAYAELLNRKGQTLDRLMEPLKSLRKDGRLKGYTPSDAALAISAMAHGLVMRHLDGDLFRQVGPGTPPPGGDFSDERGFRMLLGGIVSAPDRTT